MGTVTLRVRSVVWFVTGAVLSAAVAVIITTTWRVDAAPGDTDATFVPITPCRLADTRPIPLRVGPAAALGPGETQPFAVHGDNGECAIPAEAVAVSTNVTALGASTQTFLTFWPDGELPLAASLNPAPGEPPTPNAVTVDLSAAGGFNVYNEAGTVNVVIDVNGYYIQSSLTEIYSRLTALEGAGFLTRIIDLENTTAELEASQPFAVMAHVEGVTIARVDGDVVVVSVAVAAPVDGHVTVTSTASVLETDPGQGAACSISETEDSDPSNLQVWDSAGGFGDDGQVVNTRTFAVVAGQGATYNLVCYYIDAFSSTQLLGTTMTAIFTPAP